MLGNNGREDAGNVFAGIVTLGGRIHAQDDLSQYLIVCSFADECSEFRTADAFIGILGKDWDDATQDEIKAIVSPAFFDMFEVNIEAHQQEQGSIAIFVAANTADFLRSIFLLEKAMADFTTRY